ncbi:Threonine dehydratase, catabolic [Roseibacterium elongatum DSM 19469]|uniref:Threonine dehydratase, catabolic n=1 Tax=Roseicyclus elongatus DSM 19469 TaxID=1294273 RepID=W8S4F0_9RHOB|nr:threonine/serine dehydratase [Roseibacterium elongatum]AHM05072.1 Threonine dehydratase, catabolic [Roseibacterium elongatum DSM 19469]
MPGCPISLSDIRQAAVALRGVVIRTPVLENPDVNAMLGGRLLLKAETMQRTGAFKIRGAYHRMLGLSGTERARGAVTYSSGNHALGLARAAQLLGSSAVIVMPDDAPGAKMAAVRAMGAEIVTYDRDSQDSADVVAGLIAETGRVEVPPSAHPQVLAGAGTAALELLEDAGPLDAVLVPCGGGGLTAAMAITMAEAAPDTQVFAAEPALFDDTRRSLLAGGRVPNPKGRRTICDAIMTPIPGELTFSINGRHLAGGVTATDAEVRDAMRFAYDHFRIVAEPGAVVGLAAILNGQVPVAGRSVATVITGGNIDPARFADLLSPSPCP